MSTALRWLRIWLTCTLIVLLFWGAVALGFALFSPFWHDRLLSGNHPVTATVTGERSREHQCGHDDLIAGHDWMVTWRESGHLRHGYLRSCAHAPAPGTRLRAYAGASDQLTTESTQELLIWWPIISAGMGAVLAGAWLTGRGRRRRPGTS